MVYKTYGTLIAQSSSTVLSQPMMEPSSQSSNSFFRNKKLFGMCRSSLLFSVYLFIYIVYLACGAAIFSTLECSEEQNVKSQVKAAIQKFLLNNPSVTDDAVDGLITEVIKASSKGVSVSRNLTEEPNWSFGQSLFFSSTVVTTIGYGHITPLTRNGKLFCMCYAIVGIPLTLVLLSGFVQRLLTPTISLLQWLNRRLGDVSKPFNIQLLHLLIMALMFIGFFLVIPASIFAFLEPEWDFLDSLYYCFISLTTVGLGDYIPGDSPGQTHRSLYKIAITGYLLLGMTFMMLTLAVFYEIPQLNLGLLFTNEEEKTRQTMKISATTYLLHQNEFANGTAKRMNGHVRFKQGTV